MWKPGYASIMKQQMAASAYNLKPAEIRKLFIAAPNFRDRCILKSLYWLGLRRQELIDLDVRDIDFDRKRVQAPFLQVCHAPTLVLWYVLSASR